MDVKIQDIKDVTIKGVDVCFTDTVEDVERLDFFEWTVWPLETTFKTNKMVAGLLQSWHHTPIYEKLEYHEDAEIFYFFEGTAIMCFVDLDENDKPLMDSAQMVRIPAGVMINVAERKGHWVAVAEDDRYSAIVIAPKQGDIHVQLPEKICGVY
ncbi:MAG: hypothetical protein MJA31_09175 [Clostridia bacterium]|nr:hypothetical protein [Clostridia bacterium]